MRFIAALVLMGLVWDGTAQISPIGTNSNLLVVDSATGNDTNALRGRFDRPWRSVSNAVWAAQNGDTVRIRGSNNLAVFTNTASAFRAGILCFGKTNLTIEGDSGAMLFSTNYGCFIAMERCDNVTVRNLIFDNGQSFTTTHAADTLAGAIAIWGTNRNVTIENNTFQHIKQHGVGGGALGLDAVCYDTNTVVRNNTFFHVGTTNHISLILDGGCIVNLGIGAQIIGNKGRYITRGVEIQGTAPTGGRIENQLVADNTFEHFFHTHSGVQASGIATYAPVSNIQPSNMSHLTIRGNSVFRGAGTGNFIGIDISFGESIQVVDNNCRGGYRGISVASGSTTVSKVFVAGNTCIDYPQDPAGAIPIVAVDAGGAGALRNVVITRNNINFATGDGIQIGGNLVSATENIIINAGIGFAGTAGIRIALGSGDGVLASNTISGNQIIAEVAASGSGIIDESGSWTTVENNLIRGYSTPLSFGGTGRFCNDFELQTTDGTVTTVFTLTPPSNTVTFAQMEVAGITALGTNGAAYIRSHALRKNVATVTAIGTMTSTMTQEDDAAWQADIAASGATVLYRLNGASGQTVRWRSKVAGTVKGF